MSLRLRGRSRRDTDRTHGHVRVRGRMKGERERVYYSLGSATPKKRASRLHRFRISQNRDSRLLDGQCFLTYAKLGVFVGANVDGYVVAR